MAQLQKKNRKYGRNAKWCQAYKARGQQELNKGIRLLRAMRDFPQSVDRSMKIAFEGLPELVKRHAQRFVLQEKGDE